MPNWTRRWLRPIARPATTYADGPTSEWGGQWWLIGPRIPTTDPTRRYVLPPGYAAADAR